MRWMVGGLLLATMMTTLSMQGLTVNGDEATKQLRHVVIFKFKDEVTPVQVDEVAAAFAALPKKIAVIKDFEWGTDNSPEGKAAGFTHCFFVTFADEKGRDIYLPHPAHQAFVKLVGPRVDKVLVFDYWAKR